MTYSTASVIYEHRFILCTVYVILLVLHGNFVIGALGLFVAYMIFRKSEQLVGSNYVSEEQKWAPYYDETRAPEDTVEQTIIKERVPSYYKPIVTPNDSKPLCGDAGSASSYVE